MVFIRSLVLSFSTAPLPVIPSFPGEICISGSATGCPHGRSVLNTNHLRPIAMASNIHQQHCQSFFLSASPPVLSRQRSYSLPPGVALMSAEEATIIFSAAERATSRRRRMASVDTPFTVERQPRVESGSNSSLEGLTPAPMTLQNISNDLINAADHNQVAVRGEVDRQSPCPWGTDGAATKADLQSTEPFPSVPLFPTPPRRLVTSPLLKTYADGIYEYTRSCLTTVVPRFRVGSVISDEHFDHDQISSARPISRPRLESRFSDWSITTCDSSLSRQGSRTVTPGPLDGDVKSPDPFSNFRAKEPSKSDVDGSGVITYASSEADIPSSTLPPPTPHSHPRPRDDEFSYFTNFDMYLRHDESPKQSQRPIHEPKAGTFNLPPIAQQLQTIRSSLSPTGSPSNTTAVRDTSELDVVASVAATGGAVRDVGDSSPSRRFRTAHRAIRVPNLIVGAIR
jgi:hypothetical protein